MGILQEELNAAVQGVPWRILAEHIAEQLEAIGLSLSEKERERLQEHLRTERDDPFEFRRWRWWESSELTVHLTPEDEQAVVEKVERFLEHQLPELISNLSGSLADTMLQHLRTGWPREAKRQTKEIDGFRRRLVNDWEEPLSLLQMLLTIARDLGGDVDEDALQRAPTLVAVLTRLHARACQITDEISTLLSAGFADGAMARWRTLHEVVTVALLLQQHGEDLAVRYVAHEAIEARNAAKEYMRCYERLGYEPISDEEMQAIEREADAAKSRFGVGFENQYGWAAMHLGKKAPRITDIERAVGVDHMRGHYRMASHNVHANPKGVFFKLGLLNEMDILLAGPSNVGLADPGHSTAISLAQISSVLLTISMTFDNIIKMKVLSALAEEIGASFIDAQERIDVRVGSLPANQADQEL